MGPLIRRFFPKVNTKVLSRLLWVESQVQNHEYRGTSIRRADYKLTWEFLTVRRVGVPHPPTVQGSMVLCNYHMTCISPQKLCFFIPSAQNILPFLVWWILIFQDPAKASSCLYNLPSSLSQISIACHINQKSVLRPPNPTQICVYICYYTIE